MKMTVKFCKLTDKRDGEIVHGILVQDAVDDWVVLPMEHEAIFDFDKKHWNLEIVQENTCDFFMHEINK